MSFEVIGLEKRSVQDTRINTYYVSLLSEVSGQCFKIKISKEEYDRRMRLEK